MDVGRKLECKRRRNAKIARYFGEFTLWNFLDLAALLVLAWLLMLH